MHLNKILRVGDLHESELQNTQNATKKLQVNYGRSIYKLRGQIRKLR